MNAVSETTADNRTAAIDKLLHAAPVLPVLTLLRVEDAVPLARALLAGGLPVLEVTLRSTVAIEAIRAIAAELPDARVGAGTVLDRAGLDAASAAGAVFAIAPGATAALYAAAAAAPIPLLPAVATASEIMQGLEQGYRRFKFFPARTAGGVEALKAFAGPFPQVRFCPTGGIDAESAPAYLALPNVITVGGSWMAPAAAIEARDWTRITALARACANLHPRR